MMREERRATALRRSTAVEDFAEAPSCETIAAEAG